MATIHADQRMARECYVASLRLTPTVTSSQRDVNQRMVAITNLDPRISDKAKMELRDSVEEWQLGGEGQNTQLGGCLTWEEAEKIKKMLTDNKDLFAWMSKDMSGIDP